MENLTEFGEVVKIKDGLAHVKFTRSAACGRCHACGMLSTQNEIVIIVENELSAAVGEQVAVSIRIRKALGASAIAYVFPLGMLIVGVLLGWLLSARWHVFASSDLTMALFGLGFALLAFLLLKIAAPLYNKKINNVYRMVGKR
jgi:sigma-E factor negative regulatory protein RseC